jgi:thiosulfate dehydrogenase [quinone] large subunit
MKKTNEQLAYLVGRFALGINFLMHGIARMDDLSGFANSIASGFEGTLLPVVLAKAYGFFIPVFELVIGLFVLIGFYSRTSLFLGGLFMSTLIFGMAVQENWGTVGSQMIYTLFFFFMLKNEKHNTVFIKR